VTQKDRVLEKLKDGPTDIRDWAPGFRLAARIADLKAEGHDIEVTIITLLGGARVASYSMSRPWLDYPASAWDISTDYGPRGGE
jgi:hypothetical protein